MSEKYDGIRVLWTGFKMYSRSGKEINLPDFFKNKLPDCSLDGELWTKRGLQQESIQLTRSISPKVWNKANFCVFDIPDEHYRPYEERMEILKNLSKDNDWPSFLRVIEIVKCQGRDHLKEFFGKILSEKGEGVMLREPNSKYESGRSNAMKKYKELEDTEVKVIKNMFPQGFQCQQ